MNNTLSAPSAISAPAAPTLATAPPPPPSKDIGQAAKDFEALLLTQILKTAREGNGGGWLGGGDDQAGATMVEVAEEHLAKTLAAGRGLGIAQLLLSHIAHQSPTDSPGVPQPAALQPTRATEPHSNNVNSSPPAG